LQSDKLSDCHCHLGFHGPHGGPCNLTEITCLESELTNAVYTCGSDKSTICPVVATNKNYGQPEGALDPDASFYADILVDGEYAYVEIDLGIPRMVTGGKEGPSTLAILITEDPTALQYWSEL